MDLQKVTLPLLILDVEKNDTKQALAHVLNQHDSGYVQPFILNSGDDTYEVPAEDFHFRASLPDNQIIDVDNSDGSLVEKGDQNWLLNLPTGVTGVPGLVKCVVYAKDNGCVLASSQQIMYNVMPAFDVDDITHVSYVPDLDKLKANLQNLLGKAQEQVSRLSGITAGDKQAAEQALKEELDKLGKQAGDWLDGEKANINKQIADIVKQSSGLDEAYKQAYKEEIDKLAGQTSKDYEAKLQAVIDKLNNDKQASLQAINDDWTKQKVSLQTDIADFKDNLTKQVESITDSVKALNTSDLPAIQAKVNSFKDALDKLNGQINAIKLDYYTKAEINDKLDNLKAGTTPDLADLKKQVQDNTTSLQSKVGKDELVNYALKSDVPTAPDLTGYAKTADVNKELDAKADKTALDAYALKSELPAMPDLSAYAKVTALENYATKQALDAYALKTDLPDLTGYAKKTDLPNISGLETQADHANDVKKINETLETYAKKSELPSTDGLETKADHKADVDKLNEALDSKADKTALDSKADKTALDSYALKTDVPASPDLSSYAKTADLAAYETSANHKADIDKLNKALEGKADVSAIPALPDMSQYALKTDLKNVDLTGYLTKDDADRLLGEKANESELADYAKKTDLPPVPNLTVYAKVTDVAKALNNKADTDALREYAKTADVEKAHTAAINAIKAARFAMLNSQNAVRGIQVDKGPALPKDSGGFVNLPLGLSTYLKKADADNEYAKKTDIPAIPDTSNFVTNDSLTDKLQNYNDALTDKLQNYNGGYLTNWDAAQKYETAAQVQDLIDGQLGNINEEYAPRALLNDYTKTTDLPKYLSDNYGLANQVGDVHPLINSIRGLTFLTSATPEYSDSHNSAADKNGVIDVNKDAPYSSGPVIFPSVLNTNARTIDDLNKYSKANSNYILSTWITTKNEDGSQNTNLRYSIGGNELAFMSDIDKLAARVKALESKLNK